ncbi:MAG: polysaccharide deacetylase family protein [Planctomycetes bacterium]|nr:polysaccharide deacetylase family protein [Planctomycetota bacterium]
MRPTRSFPLAFVPGLALLLALPCLAQEPASAQAPGKPEPTWAARLGYPPEKRVLILHADDIGMCYEANQAAKACLEGGRIQSAAAMVPCPWFDEIAAWYKEHPDLDVGLHLALTSEWRHYRWGPVAPRHEVPGLVDPDGYLWRSVLDVATRARAAEVEKEIRAQVERALSRGIRPGHLDTHMGTLYARLDFTRAYLKVAEEYGIPAMAIELTPGVLEEFQRQGYPLTEETRRISREYKLPKLDGFKAAPEGKTYEEKHERFFALVRSLPPGITEIIFHPSVETEGLKKITGSWQQRVWEARLFSDPETKRTLETEGVLFTDWKEMMRRHADRGKAR